MHAPRQWSAPAQFPRSGEGIGSPWWMSLAIAPPIFLRSRKQSLAKATDRDQATLHYCAPTPMPHRCLPELVFDRDCPHVSLAREVLRAALVAAARPVQWREWERRAVDTPVELRKYGSPTILVAGTDVASVPPLNDSVDSCRLYRDEAGVLRGVPPLDLVIAALARSCTEG